MLFCDFSPHPDRYREFVDAGAFVLDHHKTVRSITEAFGDRGVFGDITKTPGICGATIAYDKVWRIRRQLLSPREIAFGKRIAELTGIRDTWQTNSPDWRDACILTEAIRFYPEAFWMSAAEQPDLFAKEEWWDERLAVGQILVERTEQKVQDIIKTAYRFTTSQGTRVMLFSARETSDVAKAVHKDIDLVAGFNYAGIREGNGILTFSVRSNSTFDCGDFCKRLGGGGHAKAAGFAVKFNPDESTQNPWWHQDPYSIFRKLLNEYVMRK